MWAPKDTKKISDIVFPITHLKIYCYVFIVGNYPWVYLVAWPKRCLCNKQPRWSATRAKLRFRRRRGNGSIPNLRWTLALRETQKPAWISLGLVFVGCGIISNTNCDCVLNAQKVIGQKMYNHLTNTAWKLEIPVIVYG